MTRSLRFLVLSVACWVGGCASVPSYGPAQTKMSTDAVRVDFLGQDGETFMFMVHNRTEDEILLLRNEVCLLVDGRKISRIPGGIQSVYRLRPGGGHDVFVDFERVHLESAAPFDITFETAIVHKGTDLPAPVFHFEHRSVER